MPRRSFSVLAAVAFALVVYVSLGIARTRGSDVAVLLIVVVGSVGAGIVAWRFADSTPAALRAAAPHGGRHRVPQGDRRPAVADDRRDPSPVRGDGRLRADPRPAGRRGPSA